MRIIVKKVRREQRKNWRGRWRRTAAFIGAAAAALSAVRWAVDETSVNVAADARIFVSISDRSSAKMPAVEAMELELLPQAKSGGNEPAINSRDSLTVDDELDDLLLDEEIDSGVSASYNGKLDVPSNVRLDRLDFGSDFVKPLRKARVTSRFDYRVNPVTGRYVFHTGMDLGAAQGSDIMAMKSGRVVSAKYNGGYGNVVIIEHSDGIRTLYAHCSKLLVKAGEKVRKGQVIARVGSTGNSTGPHLHIEFRKGGKRYDPEWVIGGIYN
ncbi:MAG: M23 family metallopeptidase [Clostridia bacterium]|nr:M23 family metallopeptidase [Clostridia bacterium]